jgi:hypothetical protein
MVNEALKLHLSGALSGYAVGQVRLEDVVDSAGYSPVLASLVDLSATASHPEINYPSLEFMNALSPKSKGMMLTSALLTDNERLYKPLHSGINNHLGEMYAQDLTSLLGGEHARDGLVEMTRRACHDIGSLEHFNSGFSRICASIHPGLSLTSVKTEISESQWVDKNRAESRDFLTMVDSAPASVDVEALKDKPLTLYLKKGLKLGVVAAVLASITLGGIYATGFANTTSGFGLVDLQSRPTIETVLSKDKVSERKIVQFGEFDGIQMVKNYARDHTLQKSIDSFTADKVGGLAQMVEPGEASESALCIVHHHQIAPVTKDGNFYKFSNMPEMLVDKNLWDFFMKSHEGGHCFFQLDQPGAGDRDLSDMQLAYQRSLEETFGDLVASLDYMRETGTNDLYTDLIRPMRISTVNDYAHKTAWALDEIFPQIDPAAIHMKTKEEIPEIAKFLMEKNFMAKDGTYFPGELRLNSDTMFTPAVKAMWSEISATRKMLFKRTDDPLAMKLAEDIHTTMENHYSRYTGVASQADVDASIAVYKDMAADYNLKPVETVQVAKAQVSKPLDSLLSAYL